METKKSQLDSSKEKMKKKKHYFRNPYCMASKFTLYVHKHLESDMSKFQNGRATNTAVIGVFLATLFKLSPCLHDLFLFDAKSFAFRNSYDITFNRI